MLPQTDVAAVLSLCGLETFLVLPHADRTAFLSYYCYLVIGTLIDRSATIHWIFVMKITILLSIAAFVVTVTFWLLMTAYFRRSLLLTGDQGPLHGKEVLGKPLLFSTKLSHSRMFPERYNYTYNYFLVGVPVGLCGQVGSVLSIDTARPELAGSSKQKRPSTKCWFKIDQRYYLEPGNSPLGLEGKLHKYLRAQGEDPMEWPHAYMISIPKFLWFTRNAVSWWLLYSADREVTAMVMEVNNSFGERKAAFFRLIPGSAESTVQNYPKKTNSIPAVVAAGVTQDVHFVSSTSKHKIYKGNWDKDFFLSPFEKVEGYFTTTCSDPCNPGSGTKGPLHSNTTLYAPNGKPKIISRLYSWGDPLDPLSAPPLDLIRFILAWGYVGALSKPRIIYEALRVRFRGNLTYHRKPEVRRGNIPRDETDFEKSLEPFFRQYLSHVVSQFPRALTLEYKPSKSHYNSPQTFQSNNVDEDSSISTFSTTSPTPTLEVQILSPELYTSILQYPDARSGIETELALRSLPADRMSQRLWTSDPALLHEIVAFTEKSSEIVSAIRMSWIGQFRKLSISWLRRSSTPTFMDEFVYSHLSVTQQTRYQVIVTRYLLAERFAFGSHSLLGLYHLVLCVALTWIVLAATTQSLSLEVPVVEIEMGLNILVIVYGGWVNLRNFL